jgi:Predicted membrane protein
MIEGRTLILSIDRDDDIGFKGHIPSPLIGRASCLEAANTLALVDPEDSDLNAIFQAIKMFDELQGRGENVEIAVLSGNHEDMLSGDRKIAADLDHVVKLTGATSCILVTDGVEDEYVLPLIQSRIKVSNVRRVVVTQIPNLESTYYIIRKLFEDPKIARVTLVPLGLAMLLYAIAYLIGYPEGATIIVFGIVGIYFLFKGFGLDEMIHYFMDSLRTSLTHGRLSFVTFVVAVLISIIGAMIGLGRVMVYYPIGESLGLFLITVTFVYGSVAYFVLAGLIFSIGKIIDAYLNEPESLGKVIVLPFFIGAIGIVAFGVSIYTLSLSAIPDFPHTPGGAIESLALALAAGLVCAFIGVYIQTLIRRWQGHIPATVH